MNITISDIMNPIIDTTRSFIVEQIGLSENCFNNVYIEQVPKLVLKKVASFINIKGILKGKFIMSMDENMVRNIIHNFVLEELTEEEETACMEDTLAECSNIILGNSIKMFPNIEESVAMDTPTTMLSDNAVIKYSENGIWTCNVESEYGGFSISFVTDDLKS